MASALMEIRVSHETDEPISPERQQGQTEATAIFAIGTLLLARIAASTMPGSLDV